MYTGVDNILWLLLHAHEGELLDIESKSGKTDRAARQWSQTVRAKNICYKVNMLLHSCRIITANRDDDRNDRQHEE